MAKKRWVMDILGRSALTTELERLNSIFRVVGAMEELPMVAGVRPTGRNRGLEGPPRLLFES